MFQTLLLTQSQFMKFYQTIAVNITFGIRICWLDFPDNVVDNTIYEVISQNYDNGVFEMNVHDNIIDETLL